MGPPLSCQGVLIGIGVAVGSSIGSYWYLPSLHYSSSSTLPPGRTLDYEFLGTPLSHLQWALPTAPRVSRPVHVPPGDGR